MLRRDIILRMLGEVPQYVRMTDPVRLRPQLGPWQYKGSHTAVPHFRTGCSPLRPRRKVVPRYMVT